MRKKIVRWAYPIPCAHCGRKIPKTRIHVVVTELGMVICGNCMLFTDSTKPVHAKLFPDCESWHDMYDHKTLSATSRDLAASALTYWVDESVRWSNPPETMTGRRAAAELVILGDFSGSCLVARSKTCICACACKGQYHGALAEALISGLPLSEDDLGVGQ